MKVEVKILIEYGLEEVWKWAGGFNLLPVISSGCVGSVLEDGGRVRVLTNADGSILWERLLIYDETERTLNYRIEDTKGFQGAYDVGYIGNVKLIGVADGETLFHYTGTFEPVRGATEEYARRAVEGFANDCCSGIRRVLSRLNF